MAVRDEIRKSTKKSIKTLKENGEISDVKIPEIKVEYPRGNEGDYATTAALQLAPFLGRKPKTLAKLITRELKKDARMQKIVKNITVASPGFINFTLDEAYLRKRLWSIFSDAQYGNVNTGKGERVNLEFGSLNPTGELHVGHARTIFYGDVLANILSFANYKVVREYYVNNARQSAQIKELGKTVLGKGTSYKGPYLEKKIKEYKKAIKRMKDPKAAGHFMANKILRDIEEFLKNEAKIEFDVWREEEDLYEEGLVKKTLKYLQDKGLTYEKDGAIWLKTTKYSDSQDQVLVRSNGENTYFLTDIAYHRDKAKRKFKTLIDVWGADHQGHVRRMKSALSMLNIKNIHILIAQMVRLKGGAKMSKRKGEITTISDLINEVGLDAVRYFYLTKSLSSQMEFDLALARKQSQKNPVYYLQYTHARICGILEKAGTHPLEEQEKRMFRIKEKDLNVLNSEGEMNLVRQLIRFPEIIEDIAKDYQVHRLPTYILELSQEFNRFYRDFKVIHDDETVQQSRLILTVATGMVIRNSLELLGINAPSSL